MSDGEQIVDDVHHRKLHTSDILALVYRYFKKLELNALADKIEKMSGESLSESESPLSHKSLKKIVQYYIVNHPKVLKQFEIKHEEVNVDEEEEEEQEENDEEEEQTVNKKRKHSEKNGKQKGAAKKQQQQQEEEEEEQVEEKPKKKKKKQKQVVEEEEEEQQQNGEEAENGEEASPVKNTDEIYYKEVNGKKFFSKFDEARIENLKDELKDNTFQAKFKFGQGDHFGQEGWNRLKDKHGKEFKKEKNKLKNKNFCGGNFSINPNAINSIKL